MHASIYCAFQFSNPNSRIIIESGQFQGISTEIKEQKGKKHLIPIKGYIEIYRNGYTEQFQEMLQSLYFSYL